MVLATVALLHSIAEVIISILLVAVLWYLVLVLKNVQDISERLRRGSERVEHDLFLIRQKVVSGGSELWSDLKTFLHSFTRFKKGPLKEKKDTDKKEGTSL